MIANTSKWSLAPVNQVVPSPWQATSKSLRLSAVALEPELHLDQGARFARPRHHKNVTCPRRRHVEKRPLSQQRVCQRGLVVVLIAQRSRDRALANPE